MQADDQVVVGTPTGVLVYMVKRVDSSPQDGSLPAWAIDSTVPNRMIIVTCEREQGQQSTAEATRNIVIEAILVAATLR